MKAILYIILIGLTLVSCNEDKLVGQWKGRAEYTDSQSETECEIFEFDILRTESNAYHGNGIIKSIDCKSGKMYYSSDFRVTSISIDKPMIYFELRLDESPDNVRYRFQGTLEDKIIKGKLYTWTSSSTYFDLSFKINFEKLK